MSAPANVGFAEKGSFVARLLEKIGDEGKARRNLAFDVRDGAGGVRVHAGKHGGTRRQAEGVHDEGVAEGASLAANAIQIWGVQDLVAGRRHFIPTQTFAHDADDVRPLGIRVEVAREGFEGIERAGGARGSGKVFEDCAAGFHGPFRRRALWVARTHKQMRNCKE